MKSRTFWPITMNTLTTRVRKTRKRYWRSLEARSKSPHKLRQTTPCASWIACRLPVSEVMADPGTAGLMKDGTGGYGSGSGAGTDPGQGTGSGPYVYQAPPQKRKGLSAVWWVILGIFAAPVALPVAIAAGALAIAVFIALGALALALLLCVAAFFIAGIVLIGAGIAILFVDFPSAMLGIGIGLATIGLMALLGCGVVVGAKALFRLIARKMNEKRQEKAAKKEVKFDE